MLTYLGESPVYRPDQTFDWRLSATRQLGPWGIHLDLSGRVEGRARYVLPNGIGSGDDHAAIVVGLTRAF